MKIPHWLNKGFPIRLIHAVLMVAFFAIGLVLMIIAHKINGIGHLFMGEIHSAKKCLFEVRAGMDVRDWN